MKAQTVAVALTLSSILFASTDASPAKSGVARHKADKSAKVVNVKEEAGILTNKEQKAAETDDADDFDEDDEKSVDAQSEENENKRESTARQLSAKENGNVKEITENQNRRDNDDDDESSGDGEKVKGSAKALEKLEEVVAKLEEKGVDTEKIEKVVQKLTDKIEKHGSKKLDDDDSFDDDESKAKGKQDKEAKKAEKEERKKAREEEREARSRAKEEGVFKEWQDERKAVKKLERIQAKLEKLDAKIARGKESEDIKKKLIKYQNEINKYCTTTETDNAELAAACQDAQELHDKVTSNAKDIGIEFTPDDLIQYEDKVEETQAQDLDLDEGEGGNNLNQDDLEQEFFTESDEGGSSIAVLGLGGLSGLALGALIFRRRTAPSKTFKQLLEQDEKGMNPLYNQGSQSNTRMTHMG